MEVNEILNALESVKRYIEGLELQYREQQKEAERQRAPFKTAEDLKQLIELNGLEVAQETIDTIIDKVTPKENLKWADYVRVVENVAKYSQHNKVENMDKYLMGAMYKAHKLPQRKSKKNP